MNKLVIAILMAIVPALGYAGSDQDCKTHSILIENVEMKDLLRVFDEIQKCALEQPDEPITVYVTGSGGSVSNAIAFFDLIRANGLHKKTVFVAIGRIWSASNIVWLASETRIVLPNSSFLLHGATWNMSEEDAQTRKQSEEQIMKAEERVLVSARLSDEVVQYALRIFLGNEQGTVRDARSAVEMGWATEIREYSD